MAQFLFFVFLVCENMYDWLVSSPKYIIWHLFERIKKSSNAINFRYSSLQRSGSSTWERERCYKKKKLSKRKESCFHRQLNELRVAAAFKVARFLYSKKLIKKKINKNFWRRYADVELMLCLVIGTLPKLCNVHCKDSSSVVSRCSRLPWQWIATQERFEISGVKCWIV